MVLTACLLSVSVLNVSAAVNDNVGIAPIQQSIGAPLNSDEPQTVFDWFRKLWLQLTTLETTVASVSSDTSGIDARLSNIESSIARLSGQMTNVTATAGGGCYYTVYSRKPYLEGYKLKLSDGTSSKSCIVNWDDDSRYYAGVLKAPLKDAITIEIIDNDSGVSQGKVNTSVSTTSGYATIDLDPLWIAKITDFVNVSDTFAQKICCDSTIVTSSSYFRLCQDSAVNRDTFLGDYLHALNGATYSSSNRYQLFRNPTDFYNSVVNNQNNQSLLNSSVFLTDLINNYAALRTIYNSNDLSKYLFVDGRLTGWMQNSSLIRSETATAEEGNSVTGNLILTKITSSSTGYKDGTGTGQSHWAYCPVGKEQDWFAVRYRYCQSQAPNCYANDEILIPAKSGRFTYTSEYCTTYYCRYNENDPSWPVNLAQETKQIVRCCQLIRVDTLVGQNPVDSTIYYIDLDAA